MSSSYILIESYLTVVYGFVVRTFTGLWKIHIQSRVRKTFAYLSPGGDDDLFFIPGALSNYNLVIKKQKGVNKNAFFTLHIHLI